MKRYTIPAGGHTEASHGAWVRYAAHQSAMAQLYAHRQEVLVSLYEARDRIRDLEGALAAAEKRARIAEAALALADALRNRDRKYAAAAPGIDIAARVKFVDHGPLVEVKS